MQKPTTDILQMLALLEKKLSKLFQPKAPVSFILRLDEISFHSTFVNQPELTDFDTIKLVVTKQASKVLQAVAAVGSSHLHRYMVV